MGEILWHRWETKRQTEKTNFALKSGECPIYSKPQSSMRYMLDTNILMYLIKNRPPGIADPIDALPAEGVLCMSFGRVSRVDANPSEAAPQTDES
jgi:hypothetical protein